MDFQPAMLVYRRVNWVKFHPNLIGAPEVHEQKNLDPARCTFFGSNAASIFFFQDTLTGEEESTGAHIFSLRGRLLHSSIS